MNKREAKKFEKLLLAERSHLTEGIRKIEEDTLYEAARDGGGDLSSYAEAGTDNFERETALNIASTESEQLSNVTEALLRIKDGTYGDCEGCGEKVGLKRLEAIPSARYCIECQSKLEREGTL